MEVLYQDNREEHYDQLAYHHEKAGNEETAVEYLIKAGEKAFSSYANSESLTYFERALKIRKSQNMNLQKARILLGLGRAKVAMKDISVPEHISKLFVQAFDYFVESNDTQRAVGLVTEPPLPTIPEPFMDPLIERALKMASDTENKRKYEKNTAPQRRNDKKGKI